MHKHLFQAYLHKSISHRSYLLLYTHYLTIYINTSLFLSASVLVLCTLSPAILAMNKYMLSLHRKVHTLNNQRFYMI
nr:MAG TPA: hypothetical protein [Caudoviricetes sp.]